MIGTPLDEWIHLLFIFVPHPSSEKIYMNVLMFHSTEIQILQYKRIKYLIDSLSITLKSLLKNITYFFWVTWHQNLFSSILFCWSLVSLLSIIHLPVHFYVFKVALISSLDFKSISVFVNLPWFLFQNQLHALMIHAHSCHHSLLRTSGFSATSIYN